MATTTIRGVRVHLRGTYVPDLRVHPVTLPMRQSQNIFKIREALFRLRTYINAPTCAKIFRQYVCLSAIDAHDCV